MVFGMSISKYPDYTEKSVVEITQTAKKEECPQHPDKLLFLEDDSVQMYQGSYLFSKLKVEYG